MSSPSRGPRTVPARARSRARPWLSAASIAVVLASSAAWGQDHGPFPFGVRGTVLDRHRSPVAGAEVRLLRERESGARLELTTSADEEGRFGARGWFELPSREDRAWRLEVFARGYATSVLDELWVTDGVGAVGPIFLFEPVRVAGIVRDASGRPIAGAILRSQPAQASWSRSDAARRAPEAVTGESGGFEFASLPPGSVKLGVAAAGFADRAVHVELRETGQNWVDVLLEPERRLEGTVVDPTGAPVSNAVVKMKVEAFWKGEVAADREGRFVLDGLARDWAPEFSVQAAGFVPRELEGELGNELRLRLEPSRSFVIQAVREEGGHEPEILRLQLHDSTPPGGCGLFYRPVELAGDSPCV